MFLQSQAFSRCLAMERAAFIELRTVERKINSGMGRLYRIV